MKTLWSNLVSYLLLSLVLLLCGFFFVTAKPLPMKLAAVAMGLSFLVVYIDATWPDRPIANKLVKVFNLCIGSLSLAAILLMVKHYIATVPMT